MKRIILCIAALCLVACSTSTVLAPPDTRGTTPTSDQSETLVVMLGTGNPNADPERSGPATAVVVGGQAYLVDCGPGVVRRAAAAEQAGIEALAAEGLTRLFITHLHSDHTVGFADLVLTSWVLGREQALEVYGPPGVKKMSEHILAAYGQDIEVRIRGNQPQNESGIEVIAHEIGPGKIYEDENLSVTAFAVEHGAWPHAYGFRFDTAERSVVISGDTTPTDSVVEACSGCDVLVHEVYAKSGFDRREPDWQAYHAASHTSGIELGEIAARAKPKLLVLNHQLLWGATEEELVAEVGRSFDGDIVSAQDLDVY